MSRRTPPGLVRLLRPAGRQWGWLGLAVGLAALTLVAGIGLLALSGWFITAAALAGAGALVLDIFTPGAGIRALAVTRTAARYAERLIAHEATFRQLATLRVRLFGRLLELPPGQLRGLGRGETLNRLTHDIDLLDRLFLQLVSPTLGALLATLAACILVYWTAPGLAGPLLAVLLTATILLTAGTAAVRAPGRRLAAATPRLRERLTGFLGGRTELRLLGRLDDARAGVMNAASEHVEAGLRLKRREIAGRTLLHVAGLVAVWAVLATGLALHADGRIDTPALALATLAALAVADTWPPLAAGWTWLETCRRAAARVGEQVHAARGPAGVRRVPDAPLTLAAESLAFAHRHDAPVLAAVDITIPPAAHRVVTGESGSGKTTLARLLAGLESPGGGHVRLDGHDLAEYDPAGLRGHIGYLDQSPMLFTDTLAANLRLAAPQADDARLLAVLDAVELGEFARCLPDGPETWIGEAGYTVSGGEARRLALARLVLGDFPVVVLDEPTAGVDAETTRRMLDNLADWLRSRSVIVFTHDPGPWSGYRRLHLDAGRLRAD